MSAPGKQSHAHVTTFTHTQGFHQSRQLIRALAALALLSLFNKEDSHAASALAKQWRKESFHRWATIPTNLLTRAETFNRLLCAKVGLSSIWWLTLPLINSQGTLRWCASKPPLPVEQVVSGHHAQEARWISDGVKLVVELLKLLIQQISRLTLSLTARAPSEREKEMEWEASKATEMLPREKKACEHRRQYTLILFRCG